MDPYDCTDIIVEEAIGLYFQCAHLTYISSIFFEKVITTGKSLKTFGVYIKFIEK